MNMMKTFDEFYIVGNNEYIKNSINANFIDILDYIGFDAEYRNISYVKSECKKLALQLGEIKC